MQSQQLSFGTPGPLVNVTLGLSATDAAQLRQAGRPVPLAVLLTGLIDSGAEITCVDTQILAPFVQAGLSPGRIVLANIPALGGTTPTIEYVLGLTILHPSGLPRSHLVLRHLSLIDQTLGPLGYQLLLGRDVLQHCLFIYDGPARQFTLAY